MLNPGCDLDLDWVLGSRANRSAIERRAATLTGRRTVKQAWQIGWLAHGVTGLDLTTPSGDDTPGTVRRLAAKAVQPVRREILVAHDLPLDLHCGAVCVYHNLVPVAVVMALIGSMLGSFVGLTVAEILVRLTATCMLYGLDAR